MIDYQQKRMKAFLMPEAVYRQALWAVKDLPRLERILEEERQARGDLPGIDFGGRVSEGERNIANQDMTGRRASEIVNLSMKIEAIYMALYQIPQQYREGIRKKLTEGKPYGDEFHSNTWKKWQQAYIFHVAKNLGLY